MRFDVSQVSWVVKTADIFQVAGTWRVVGRISIALLSGLTAGPYAEFDRILCQLSIPTSSDVLRRYQRSSFRLMSLQGQAKINFAVFAILRTC